MRVLTGIDWSDLLTLQTPLLEIFLRGTAVYLALFFMLRFVLRRQSAGLGVSDLLVVVLIADAASNALGDDYRSIPDGLLLVAVLIGWAWALDALGYRFPVVQRVVKPQKLPLVRDGQMLVSNMRKELVTREELRSELRQQGIEDLAAVRVAYMEPNGRISAVCFDAEQRPAPPRSTAS